MATKRERQSAERSAEAETKLTRLLETETELESLLEDARARAQEILKSGRERAAERLGELERELEEQDAELRERVSRERDDAIRALRTAARQQVDRLGAIPDEVIADVAQQVLARLLDSRDTGGSP